MQVMWLLCLSTRVVVSSNIGTLGLSLYISLMEVHLVPPHFLACITSIQWDGHFLVPDMHQLG